MRDCYTMSRILRKLLVGLTARGEVRGGHGLFVRGPRIVRDGDDTGFAVVWGEGESGRAEVCGWVLVG